MKLSLLLVTLYWLIARPPSIESCGLECVYKLVTDMVKEIHELREDMKNRFEDIESDVSANAENIFIQAANISAIMVELAGNEIERGELEVSTYRNTQT